MRVCYVTMQLPTTYETFAANDLRTLRRLGVDLAVHSLRPAHADAALLAVEQELEGITFTHNSTMATWAGIRLGLRHPVALLELLGWVLSRCWKKPDHLVRSLILLPRALQIFHSIRQARPDVVHLFWGHYPSLVGHLVRRYLPKTTLSVFVGAYDLIWNYGGTPSVAAAADVVWTHSRENVPAILRLGVPEERLEVAYRGVDLARFAPLQAGKVHRRIVSASRLIPAKAADDVIRVFAQALREWPDATLVILGDGPERARMEAFAMTLGVSDAVTFRGHVAQEVVLREMAAAEAFLLMSRNESERLPNVVKEAMASRCLCVVTRSPGIEELLRDGVHGYLVAEGDIDTAARRVAQALAGGAQVRALVDAAARQIHDNFDVMQTMRRYLEHWSRLAPGGGERSPERALKGLVIPAR
jgi:glycosyltransferase involved in cell wall biosynthesis